MEDILESRLGTVPSANTATSAETAASASTASNASALEGLGADAFLRSDRATFRNPVSVDDPVGGDKTTTPLMTVGPLTIEGECSDNGTQRVASMRYRASSADVQFPRIWFDGGTPCASGTDEVLVGPTSFSILTVASDAPRSGMGTFSLHHPGSNTYRTGTMFSSVNSAGDCAFAIIAFG